MCYIYTSRFRVGSELLCFLDAYFGYHQIPMKKSDQIKTSFVTPFRTVYYKTMPFRVKNARETYQCTMQRCLNDQIKSNVHVNIDGIEVMSKKKETLISDLEETFASLRKFNMTLNPKKCFFEIPARKLLGFIVFERGIEVNREKIKAIL